LRDLTAAPLFPELWKSESSGALLLDLLLDASSRLVRVWAMGLLQRDHLALLGSMNVADIRRLLDHPDEQVQILGAQALENSTRLGQLTVEEWFDLLAVQNPTVAETIVGLPGTGKADDVGVNDLNPMANGRGCGLMLQLVMEPKHSVPNGRRVEFRQGRRRGIDDRLLIDRLLITHPTDLPPLTGLSVKGEEHVRRRNAGVPLSHKLPAPIEKDAPTPFVTGEEERAAEVHAHHFEWGGRIRHCHVRDVVVAQRGTILRGDLEEFGLRTDDVRFLEFGAGTRHGGRK